MSIKSGYPHSPLTSKDRNKLKTEGVFLSSFTLLLTLGTFGTYLASGSQSNVLAVSAGLSIYLAFVIWTIWKDYRFGWILLGLPYLCATGTLIVGTVLFWITDPMLEGHGSAAGGIVLLRYVCPFLAIVCALPLVVSIKGWIRHGRKSA